MTHSLLFQLRRRLLAQAFCNTLGRVALASAGLVLLGVAVASPQPWPVLGGFAAAALLAAVAFAALWTFLRRPALPRVAAMIDRRADTRDRLATALAFETSATPLSPLRKAALAECETFLAGFDARPFFPWRIPEAAPWLIVPLLSILLLQFRANPTASLREAQTRPPDAAALRVAARLEAMAKKLESEPKKPSGADLQKVAEALKKSAKKLQADASGEAPEKATLRELSALEEVARAASEGSALETLGDALASVDAAKDAAAALKKQNPKEAADKLEELGKRLTESKNMENRLKQLAKAMAEAARQLGPQSGLGAGASQVASAAQSGDAPAAGQALGKMGQSLRESNSPGGKGSASQAMRGMISALQEMKSGKEGETKESAPDKSETSSGRLLAAAQGSGKPTGESAQGMGDSPGGKPGSEHDFGTKGSALGKAATPPAEVGVQAQIQGMLGSGESLRSLVPARPGAEPAKTGYKELYETMAPAAEDALEQESIPVGSRLFVKRYFEAIRPK